MTLYKDFTKNQPIKENLQPKVVDGISKSTSCFTFQIIDRFRRNIDIEVPYGNICIIGNYKQIYNFIRYFISSSPIPLNIVTVKGVKFKTHIVNNQQIVRVILVDTEKTPINKIDEIIRSCVTCLLFRPSSRIKANNIIGKTILNRVIGKKIFNIVKGDEFLEINPRILRICRLPKFLNSRNSVINKELAT